MVRCTSAKGGRFERRITGAFTMSQVVINLPSLKGKIIAIDGPAGAGKTTTSRLVAARLNFRYLDTGAMYRALTWFALKNNVMPSDDVKLTALAQRLPIDFKMIEGVNHVSINGEDVTDFIRTPEITKHVSEVSAHKGVREAMVNTQRKIGREGSLVAEGRDTTTVVFPNADIKIYLDASVEQRAKRRLLDMSKIGVTTTLEEQMEDIERRDKYDSSRTHSPLTRAKDAIVIDTSNLSIEQQVEHIIDLVRSLAKAT